MRQWYFLGGVLVGLLLLIMLWLVAWQPAVQTPASATAVPTMPATALALRPVATATATATPSPTPTSTATATLTPSVTPSPSVTNTPEAIIPTATNTPDATAVAVPDATIAFDLSASQLPTPMPLATATVRPPGAIPQRSRFGIAGHLSHAGPALDLGLPFGAFINWNVAPQPPFFGIDFWQTVRIDANGIRRTTWDEIATAVATVPGSFWVVGNEPDVRWQDNVTPERYAEIYHEVYTFIKTRDPSARLVIAGVSQPTPLRQAYLDRVLNAYRVRYGSAMPIDVWNVHAFVLREEADSWGVGIPPGMDGTLGMLYEIEDHDNLDIFRQNLIDFRAWMTARGYGDRPLVVSEYGILLPHDYGFPPESVANFMRNTQDFFQTAVNETGYAADGGRLVQWWFWYSLYDDGLYPSGNLYDAISGELTPLGAAWRAYFNNTP